MRSIYDAVKAFPSIGPVVVTGTLAGTVSTGSAVDTKGFNTAMIVVKAGLISAGAGTIVVTLKECATSGGSYANALDNSGVVIGFTLLPSAFAQGQARIEGLGLNRLRFLKAVTTFTADTTGTSAIDAEILQSRAFADPQNASVTSNT